MSLMSFFRRDSGESGQPLGDAGYNRYHPQQDLQSGKGGGAMELRRPPPPPERSPESSGSWWGGGFGGGGSSTRQPIEDTYGVQEEQIKDQTQKEIISKLLQELDRRTPAAPQPIYIQNNLQSQQMVHTEQKQGTEVSRSNWWEAAFNTLNTFFSSSFNRFCFFSSCGIGLTIVYGHFQHKWRMQEMQKRIDANFFLRLTQVLLNEGGQQRRS